MKFASLSASIVALIVAQAAQAQTTAFDGRGAADDQIEDLEEAIVDDAERDITFGNDGREIGTYGSVAFRMTSTSNDGDTDTDVGAGLRFGWYDGTNGVDLSLSYVYGNEDGTATEDTLLAGVDYRRDLNDRLFVYGQTDLAMDRLAEDVGDFERDLFVGAGLGYRVVDTPRSVWSLQAGPGYRWAEVVGGEEVKEAAASLSSNALFRLTDTATVTSDTDVIFSDYATTVSNDFAINYALTDQMALRTSYSTRFNDESDDSFGDAESILGVSVVYNFN